MDVRPRMNLQRTELEDSLTLKGRTIHGFRSLPRTDALRLQASLVAQAGACGCNEGAIGLLLSVGSYVLGTAVLPLLRGAPIATSWPIGLGVGLAGGAIGKGIGLLVSHYRFERLRHEVEALANTRHTIGPRAIAIDSTGGL